MSGSDSDSFLSADEDYSSSKAQIKPANSPKASRGHNKSVKQKKLQCHDDAGGIVEENKPRLSTEGRTQDNNNSDDGWDDWDDDADNQNNPISEKKLPAEKSKGQIENLTLGALDKAKPSNDNDGDGWDDWGDDEDDNLSVETSHSELKTASKTKTQMPSLSTTASNESGNNVSSSYDTLPVLRELQSDSKKTQFTKDHKTETERRENEIVEKPESSWGWKNWGGVVSFLSNATEGVSTLTSQVSQGFCNVLENSIGVPDPEEMARLKHEEEKNQTKSTDNSGNEKILVKKDSKEDLIRSSVGNLLTGVTQIGNKVITGGLDTLEGIGKKTMTILQENDPLLLNKRKLLGLDGDKPVLSQILREAKEKSEETENKLKQIQKNSYKKQLHFEMLFDHYHGLVHLEALEMLSKQSSLKLQSLLEPLTGKALAEMQETLNEVKELCDLGELDEENDCLSDPVDLKEKLSAATEDLGIEVDFAELVKCWEDNSTSLAKLEDVEPQEIYNKALRCLAETTALIVSKMHKIAELILIQDHHSTANEADSLVQLTHIFCLHLRSIANLFGAKLNTYETTEETSSLITSIFLEESSSSSYVKSAFQLFIPILQMGAA